MDLKYINLYFNDVVWVLFLWFLLWLYKIIFFEDFWGYGLVNSIIFLYWGFCYFIIGLCI